MNLDLLVIGGGLAGCCVAWQAKRRGLDVGLIDRCRDDSASRVAAGLVTPITGSRLALTWRWAEYFPIAGSFYRSIETQTGVRFWHEQPAWRLFGSQEERVRFETRWNTAAGFSEQALHGIGLVSLGAREVGSLHAPWGGMSMSPAGRLVTETFLNATSHAFQTWKRFWSTELDLEHDIRWDRDAYIVAPYALRCTYLFDCRGFGALDSGWFRELPLHPARGDILELVAASTPLPAIVHADAWAVPLDNDRVLLGATYDRHALHSEVVGAAADAAKRELLDRWDRMTRAEASEHLPSSAEHRVIESPPHQDNHCYRDEPRPRDERVLRQRAAVRPASFDRHPLVGLHSNQPNMACLNGLGSKGSLMGPGLAEKLLAHVVDGRALEPELLWNRRGRGRSRDVERGAGGGQSPTR